MDETCSERNTPYDKKNPDNMYLSKFKKQKYYWQNYQVKRDYQSWPCRWVRPLSRCYANANGKPQPTSKNYSPDNPFNNGQDRHYSPRNLISDRTLIILFSCNTLFFLQHDSHGVRRDTFATNIEVRHVE